LGTFESVLRKEFPNARGEEYLPKSPFQLTRKFFVKTYNIATNSEFFQEFSFKFL